MTLIANSRLARLPHIYSTINISKLADISNNCNEKMVFNEFFSMLKTTDLNNAFKKCEQRELAWSVNRRSILPANRQS